MRQWCLEHKRPRGCKKEHLSLDSPDTGVITGLGVISWMGMASDVGLVMGLGMSACVGVAADMGHGHYMGMFAGMVTRPGLGPGYLRVWSWLRYCQDNVGSRDEPERTPTFPIPRDSPSWA